MEREYTSEEIAALLERLDVDPDSIDERTKEFLKGVKRSMENSQEDYQKLFRS